MRLVLVCLCIVTCFLELRAQKSSKLFRLVSATSPIIEDSYDSNSRVSMYNFGMYSIIMGSSPKKIYPLPVDKEAVLQKMMNSLSQYDSYIFIADSTSEIQLKVEAGCPPKNWRRRRFPCTLHSQLASYIQLDKQREKGSFLIPVFHISTTPYNLPASGGAIFTMADSGYDLNYVWYTLIINVYQDADLVYYDQHTYFVEEALPNGELPKIYIPQQAMDSLVNLTMKGYIDRLK